MSGTCQQNYCGPGTSNGEFGGPCNVTDAGDGFCYPYLESRGSVGICQQGGSAALGASCAANPTRVSPASQLCGTNAFCDGTCLRGCDPLDFDTCGSGMICTALGGVNSAHLGYCKTGQAFDGGFAASHLPFPQLPFNGGSVINSPRVVTLSFPGYESGFPVSSYADWIVGSNWLKTVGADYGVGNGTHVADFVFPEAAPAQVTDSQIQDVLTAWIADGGIPKPTENTIYLIYYPVTTVVSATGGVGCESFGGYHDQFELSSSSSVTYGVIATCKDQNGDPDYDASAITTSHELIEAATDPDPNALAGNPGYRFNDLSLAWTYTFPEAADLCVGSNGTYDGSWMAQRIWSNSAARAGSTSPCVPVPTGEIYSNASALPNATQFLPASNSAQVVTYQITAWSLAPASDWYFMPGQIMGNFSPTMTLTGGSSIATNVSQVNNGDALTLQVTIPPGTPSGSYAGIELISAASMTSYTLWPVGVYIR